MESSAEAPTGVFEQLTKHEYGASKFDVILDLSTIDHIHPKDIENVLRKYKRWLKRTGTLWLVVWLNQHVRWRDVPIDANPSHQYYFEKRDFEAMMEASGFLFAPGEVLMGSPTGVGLFSYVCRKGYA
jgi:SAM-dependent methyltransferase